MEVNLKMELLNIPTSPFTNVPTIGYHKEMELFTEYRNSLRTIMQKVVNIIALLSGLTSAAVIGGGAYLFLNKDAMIERVKSEAIEEVTKTVTGKVPAMIKDALPAPPKLPTKTGPVLDFDSGFKTDK